ncbi:MAG TPA: hypothetical protein VNQ79_07455 [Blastocatellia bacterium]|nr:hypothetical protein [Blastocatellia bacterium]
MPTLQTDQNLIREEAARLGDSIYETRLKALLEPAFDGQVVAIHLPSQEYFLGPTLLDAADQLRRKYPEAGRGEIYGRRVGSRAIIRAHTPRVTGGQP